MNPPNDFQRPRVQRPFRRILPIQRPGGTGAQRNSGLQKDENNRWLIIGRIQRQPFQWVDIQSDKMPGNAAKDSLPGEGGTENIP